MRMFSFRRPAPPASCTNCHASYVKGHEAGRKQADSVSFQQGYATASTEAEAEMTAAHIQAAAHQEELIDLALMMAWAR